MDPKGTYGTIPEPHAHAWGGGLGGGMEDSRGGFDNLLDLWFRRLWIAVQQFFPAMCFLGDAEWTRAVNRLAGDVTIVSRSERCALGL